MAEIIHSMVLAVNGLLTGTTFQAELVHGKLWQLVAEDNSTGIKRVVALLDENDLFSNLAAMLTMAHALSPDFWTNPSTYDWWVTNSTTVP